MNDAENELPAPSSDVKPTVALVAYDSLGDGLVYLMMAENLRLNGFGVTYYGGRVSGLAGWFPQLSIRPYPDGRGMGGQLDNFDLVLCSPPSFLRRTSTDAALRQLAAKYVFICLGRRFSKSWNVDHRQRIEMTLPPEKSQRLQRLAACSGNIRRSRFSSSSVVQTTLDFMREAMGLERVAAQVKPSAPPGLAHRRYRSRVVLCPDSTEPARKDWTPSRILDLAVKLKSKGLDPKIVASPENIAKWRDLSVGVCESPALESVEALAAYLYESGVVVASDSGSGHLASFLGVPTVTIYRRMNPRFAWRPGWAPGVVVCPILALSIGKMHIWRPFISTAKVLRSVERLIQVQGDDSFPVEHQRKDADDPDGRGGPSSQDIGRVVHPEVDSG